VHKHNTLFKTLKQLFQQFKQEDPKTDSGRDLEIELGS